MARPSKLLPPQRVKVFKAFEEYIADNNDPTIVKFCALDKTAIQHKVTKDNIHDWKEFSELRRRAIDKQEAYLLEGAPRNRLNASVAIFRLKQPQHGYTDRQEIQHSGDGGLFGANALTIKVVDGRDNSESQTEAGV